MGELQSIARLANRALLFGQSATGLGFGSAGDIDRFVFGPYREALRTIRNAEHPRGAIFFLEPPSTKDALGSATKLATMLRQVQSETTKSFYSLKLDLVGGLSEEYGCTPADRRFLVAGHWTNQ